MGRRDKPGLRANQAMPYFAAAALLLVMGATAIAMLCGAALEPPPGESCAQCAREWVGSLSGWGAVLVGAVAAFAALANLDYLKKQVQMQGVIIATNNRYEIETRKDEAEAVRTRIDQYLNYYEVARVNTREIMKSPDAESIGKLFLANSIDQREMMTISLRSPFPEYRFDRFPAPIPYEGARFSEAVATITALYNSLPDCITLTGDRTALRKLSSELDRATHIGRKLSGALGDIITRTQKALAQIDRQLQSGEATVEAHPSAPRHATGEQIGPHPSPPNSVP